MTEMLDSKLLAEFEERLKRIGAPIERAWRPGATDEEIDAYFKPLGLNLPEEARRWWRRHDGVRDDATPSERLVGGREVLSLRLAAESYAVDGPAKSQLFDLRGLVAPVGGAPHIYVDCSGPHDAPVPILVQDDIARPVPLLPSFAALVETWCNFIDIGFWTLTPDGHWRVDSSRAPD